MPAVRIRIMWFTEVCRRIRSEDRVICYYTFFTLVIGVAAGFSFAYILFLYGGFSQEVPLQTIRLLLERPYASENESRRNQLIKVHAKSVLLYLGGYQVKSFRRPTRVTHAPSNSTRIDQDGDWTLADKLAKKVRVLCWVLTYPSNHETKAQHVKATWGKRCNKLLFVSTKEDKTLPTLNLGALREGWKFLWGKTKMALRYLYDHHRDDADWFLKADDDTYVIVDNLRYLLADYDTREPIYFGCRFKNFTPQGYMSGGAGYVLSRESLNRLVTIALDEPRICNYLEVGTEDVELGRCLYNVGVHPMDSRDKQQRNRFLPFRPEVHVFPSKNSSTWFWQYIFYPMNPNLTCCSDYAVSFHNLTPGMMYTFEYFLYHLRPYGFRHKRAPLPQILKSSEDPDSSEIEE